MKFKQGLLEGYSMDELLDYLSINKETYADRFGMLANGKRRFNFSAAVLIDLWFPFHFMFLEWAVLMLSQFVMIVGMRRLLHWNYGDEFVRLFILIANGMCRILVFVLLGFWGDQLLLMSIKRKIAFQRKMSGRADWIKRIYAKDNVIMYRLTSVMVLFVFAYIVFAEI